ncbi:hypothetical protein K440DRAFT_627727 [Wilcoxina mikolae CBS 423.85]|nr:hypothetical protein K440DRAFT_627727 [Wilcoxina mikolae CBS 423.85]
MGEASVMWNYTEEGEADEEDKEKKDEKQDGEETDVKGEVDQAILSLKIIRRPPIGAKRQIINKPPEVAEPGKAHALSETDSESEEDEDGSTKSGEIVENPEECWKDAIWKTIIIDCSG